MMEETYKGYRITYDEMNELFSALIDGVAHRTRTLKGARKFVDIALKKEFKRVKAYRRQGWHGEKGFEIVEITSVAEGRHRYSGPEAWIITAKKHREKTDLNRLIKMNKKNLELLEGMDELAERIANLQAAASALEAKLDRLTLQDLGTTPKIEEED